MKPENIVLHVFGLYDDSPLKILVVCRVCGTTLRDRRFQVSPSDAFIESAIETDALEALVHDCQELRA
jgi:hypothetical protein